MLKHTYSQTQAQIYLWFVLKSNICLSLWVSCHCDRRAQPIFVLVHVYGMSEVRRYKLIYTHSSWKNSKSNMQIQINSTIDILMFFYVFIVFSCFCYDYLLCYISGSGGEAGLHFLIGVGVIVNGVSWSLISYD